MFLLQEYLESWAGTTPERVAVRDAGGTLTYAALWAQSGTLAAAMQRWGVERGDRVAVVVQNSVESAVTVWATLRAGGVFTPIAADARTDRIRCILADSGAKLLIAPDTAAAAVQAALAGLECRPTTAWFAPPAGLESDLCVCGALAGPLDRPLDPGTIDQDLAAIIYTSGTTGLPKGAMLTHRNFTNSTGAVARYLHQTAADVTCSVLPMAFSYGLMQVLTAVRAGSEVVLEPSFTFPLDVLRRMEQYGVTMLPGVPSLFAKLLQITPVPADLGALRLMTNAADAIPPAHLLRLREAFRGVEVYPMYGQTECTRALYLDPALVDSHPESVGRAIPNCEAYLIDDGGRRLPPGAEGELVIRGSNVMRGYWGKPKETAEKLRPGDVPGEPVLHTGDRFRTDGAGLMYFICRSDDIFKCRGEKVAPAAIEHALCEMPGVAEAAVVGVPDENDGSAIKAVLVARTGETLSETRVRAFCRMRLEPGLVPRFVEIRSELPKTASGKVRRLDLRNAAPN
ncbi:MAG: AMP-binding protein [Phycisphaerales bacterium]|nr:AMP-binding protein [Phycisphaerales bacterium]